MIEVRAPERFHGDRLVADLEAAGFGGSPASVVYDPTVDALRISVHRSDGAEVDESDRDAIEAVVQAHTGEPPDEEIKKQERRQEADTANSTLTEMADRLRADGKLTDEERERALDLLILWAGGRT